MNGRHLPCNALSCQPQTHAFLNGSKGRVMLSRLDFLPFIGNGRVFPRRNGFRVAQATLTINSLLSPGRETSCNRTRVSRRTVVIPRLRNPVFNSWHFSARWNNYAMWNPCNCVSFQVMPGWNVKTRKREAALSPFCHRPSDRVL